MKKTYVMIERRMGALIFVIIALAVVVVGYLIVKEAGGFAPSPAPVVDQCHVDPDCTALVWPGRSVCVGPRSPRCDP